MKIKFLGLAIYLALGLPVAATARPDPTPPPSGIVVHLFGQDSVMSNVLPTAPADMPRAAPATGSAGQPAYVEPTAGDILHQMFVTGDPNDPSLPSTGRTKQRLSD